VGRYQAQRHSPRGRFPRQSDFRPRALESRRGNDLPIAIPPRAPIVVFRLAQIPMRLAAGQASEAGWRRVALARPRDAH